MRDTHREVLGERSLSLANYDMLSLPVILAWLRIHWGKMVLGGVACAFLAFPIALFKSKTYESTSTLLVFPPTFKEISRPTVTRDVNEHSGGIAEMMPRSLPVEAYKALALSPPMLDQVIREAGLENVGVVQLRTRLDVELVQMGSRSPQGIAYTQALMFHAKAKSPELAAKTAKTWAEVFKRQVDELSAKGVHESFTLLSTLHENTREELEKVDLALAEHVKAWNLDLIKAQLEAKQKQYTEFETNLKQTEVDLAAGEVKLKTLEAQLGEEPQKLTYFRAPSDDAYWIAGAGSGKSEPEKGLRTEEANPNYVQTRAAVITSREELEGLRAKKDTLATKLDELKAEIQDLTTTLSDKQLERTKLTRDADSLKASYAMVREEFEKGRMADRTQASDIVIAGQAVVPDAPSSIPSATLIILAFILGTCLTGAALVVRELSEMGLAPPMVPNSERGEDTSV